MSRHKLTKLESNSQSKQTNISKNGNLSGAIGRGLASATFYLGNIAMLLKNKAL